MHVRLARLIVILVSKFRPSIIHYSWFQPVKIKIWSPEAEYNEGKTNLHKKTGRNEGVFIISILTLLSRLASHDLKDLFQHTGVTIES